jgi:hypothetical protein
VGSLPWDVMHLKKSNIYQLKGSLQGQIPPIWKSNTCICDATYRHKLRLNKIPRTKNIYLCTYMHTHWHVYGGTETPQFTLVTWRWWGGILKNQAKPSTSKTRMLVYLQDKMHETLMVASIIRMEELQVHFLSYTFSYSMSKFFTLNMYC